jgi:hypothetical protein
MTWMKIALPALLPFLIAAGPSGVPRLDVESTCRSRGSTELAASSACMRDERSARDELGKMWGKIPADVRRNCLEEVKIGGLPSYVELLTCSQMNEWSRNPAPAGTDRAATMPTRR